MQTKKSTFRMPKTQRRKKRIKRNSFLIRKKEIRLNKTQKKFKGGFLSWLLRKKPTDSNENPSKPSKWSRFKRFFSRSPSPPKTNETDLRYIRKNSSPNDAETIPVLPNGTQIGKSAFYIPLELPQENIPGLSNVNQKEIPQKTFKIDFPHINNSSQNKTLRQETTPNVTQNIEVTKDVLTPIEVIKNALIEYTNFISENRDKILNFVQYDVEKKEIIIELEKKSWEITHLITRYSFPNQVTVFKENLDKIVSSNKNEILEYIITLNNEIIKLLNNDKFQLYIRSIGTIVFQITTLCSRLNNLLNLRGGFLKKNNLKRKLQKTSYRNTNKTKKQKTNYQLKKTKNQNIKK
jgi:hypothetical protein